MFTSVLLLEKVESEELHYVILNTCSSLQAAALHIIFKKLIDATPPLLLSFSLIHHISSLYLATGNEDAVDLRDQGVELAGHEGAAAEGLDVSNFVEYHEE
ncbi:hypothetical protein Droror1_Dr00002477 [Drosera rotundifolia]